jgi:hypothetical protein
MPQGVKLYAWQAHGSYRTPPIPAQIVRRQRLALNSAENQCVGLWLPLS